MNISLQSTQNKLISKSLVNKNTKIITFASNLERNLDFNKVKNTFENEIVPIYRETDHCDQIRTYLAHQLSMLKNDDGSPEFDVKLVPYLDEEGRKKANIVATRHNVNPNKKRTVILQAHMDMVWVNIRDDKENKKIKIDKNFIENGKRYWKAEGTTLGADDGIGIALALEIARSKNFKDLPLQIIFTDDEETTCAGAYNFPATLLAAPTSEKSPKASFINLDAEFFKNVIVACAGMESYKIENKVVESLRLSEIKPNQNFKELIIGLDEAKGGHARDVDKGGINIYTELFKLLKNVTKDGKNDVLISNIIGCGENDKFNAIPKRASMKLLVSEKKYEEIKDLLKSKLDEIIEQGKENGNEPDLKMIFDSPSLVADKNSIVLNPDFQTRLINVFSGKELTRADFPNELNKFVKSDISDFSMLSGLKRKHEKEDDPCKGDIITSQNIGVLNINSVDDKKMIMNLGLGLRSSDSDDLKKFNEKTKASLTYLFNEPVNQGKYNHAPAWSQVNSSLANLTLDAYREVGIENPRQKDNHGCLEVAIFSEKAKLAGKQMDCEALGPNIHDPHTVNERVEIASLEKFCVFISNLFTKLIN